MKPLIAPLDTRYLPARSCVVTPEMMQRTIVALLLLGVAGVLANVGSDHRVYAATPETCPASLASQLTPVSGLPPHASWRLPLDMQHGWRPLAVDAKYAVLGREGWPGPN